MQWSGIFYLLQQGFCLSLSCETRLLEFNDFITNMQKNAILELTMNFFKAIKLINKIDHNLFVFLNSNTIYLWNLVPKGAQEKRTEVLENKVDRMWVSNAFYEWTHVKSSTSEGRRQCCSSFLRNLTFSVICDKMLNITDYNKPTSLCC